MKTVLGIDIGGTFIKLGLVRGTKVLARNSLTTARLRNPKQLVELIGGAVEDLLAGSKTKVAGAGVGVPGLVLYPKGIVRSVVNLKGRWKDVPLGSLLSRRLKVPVSVDNDVNLMTLAEWKLGAGRGTRSLVCLTLGTGVGGGLVLDGHLYRGEKGAAGEIGHMPVVEEGLRCNCGGRGCLERYVGNQEIIRWVTGELRKGARSVLPKLVGGDLRRLSPEVIDRGCELGDPLARATWARAGSQIGLALAGVVNLLAPERVVIGGGIAKAGPWLFGPMREVLRRRAMRGLRDIPLLPARLGGSAGMMGAALLAQGVGEAE